MTLKLTQDQKNLPFLIFSLNAKWLAAQDFVEIPLIEAFITAQKFDIMFLSETLLDSTIDISDTRANLNGYLLLRADHPSYTERGGICIYHKDYNFYIRTNFIRNDDLHFFYKFSYKRVTWTSSKNHLWCYRMLHLGIWLYNILCPQWSVLETIINVMSTFCRWQVRIFLRQLEQNRNILRLKSFKEIRRLSLIKIPLILI